MQDCVTASIALRARELNMSRVSLCTAVSLALLPVLATVAFPRIADAQSPIICGSVYTVQPGDTLYEVAVSAYGNGGLYQEIYRANRDLLRDERTVEIGDKILIPCLDGANASARPDAEAPKLAAEVEKLLAAPVGSIADNRVSSLPTGERIRFLTGSDFAPFADKKSFAGGMITDLVTRAMSAAAPDQDFRVTFINDWSAHLDVLLPDGAFDVGFPWYKPDCAKAEKLSDELRMRCDEFEFSDPFYEVSIGFYSRAGDQLAETLSYDGLFGKKLCRPKGQLTFDLDLHDLMAPNVSIETPGTAGECFTRLMQGQVDVVSLVRSEADSELRQLGIGGEVAEIEGLASRQTLHALVLKSNPNGRAYLDILNQGLASLMASGEWFSVVATHRHPQLLQMN
jgi:polar amino acid transport system substrate-binding protein